LFLLCRSLYGGDILFLSCLSICHNSLSIQLLLMIPSLFGKQEVGIWRVKKRFPRYGVPIWSLWPNIRFLPSIVAEKNVTKNEHICSMCIKITYFLFAEKRGYHKWAFAHSSSCLFQYILFSMFILLIVIYFSISIGIWRVKKRFPRYGVPTWSLWSNIRFLPSIVAEKNATKNEHICSICIKINSRQTGSRNLTSPKTLPFQPIYTDYAN
jgi:hypothetical protein